MSKRPNMFEVLGADAKEVGKHVFGGVHTLGKVVLSIFGAGQVAEPLEQLESKAGILPDWADPNKKNEAPPQLEAPVTPAVTPDSTQPVQAIPSVRFVSPDYVYIVKTAPSGERTVESYAGIKHVRIQGGTRFEGPGYRKGDAPGTSFSFGYQTPVSVDFITNKKKQFSVKDASQVLVCGGRVPRSKENQMSKKNPVLGDDEVDVAQIEDELVGGNWYTGNSQEADGAGLHWYDYLLTGLSLGLAAPWAAAKGAYNMSDRRDYKPLDWLKTPELTYTSQKYKTKTELEKEKAEAAKLRLAETKAKTAWKPSGSSVVFQPKAFQPFQLSNASSSISFPSINPALAPSTPETPMAENNYVLGSDVLSCEVLGAVTPSMPSRRPSGKYPYGPALKNTGPKSKIKNAPKQISSIKKTLKKAAKTIKSGASNLKKHDVKRQGKTAIRGFDEILGFDGFEEIVGFDGFEEILGAAASDKKMQTINKSKLTPVQRKAVDKWEKAKKKSDDAAKKLTEAGKKTIKQAKKTVDAVKKHSAALKALRVKAATRVRGDDDFEEILGFDDMTAMHGRPGYPRDGRTLIDTSRDRGPVDFDAQDGLIEILGDDVDASGTVLSVIDYELLGSEDDGGETDTETLEDPFTGETVPTNVVKGPPFVSFKREGNEEAYDKIPVRKMPVDAVLFDKTLASTVTGWLGSFSYFYNAITDPAGKYGKERNYGFIFGGDGSKSEWPGKDPNKWIWVHGKQGDSGSIPDFPGWERGVSGWWNNAEDINSAYKDIAAVQQASIAKGYGPLIGNPAVKEYAGLKVDSEGNVFWLKEDAPDWATREADYAQKLAEEERARLEAEADAAEQARKDAEQRDFEEEQLRIERDAALAAQQAEGEQRIAKTQQDTADISTNAQLAAQQRLIEQQQQQWAVQKEQQERQMEADLLRQMMQSDAQAQQFEQNMYMQLMQQGLQPQGYGQDQGEAPYGGFGEGGFGDFGDLAEQTPTAADMSDDSNIDWS